MCVVNADLALQTWACPHTSRLSWQASNPWGTAAALGTLALAALRDSGKRLACCISPVPGRSMWAAERLPGCTGESQGSGFPVMAFCFSAPLCPSFFLCIMGP